MGKKVTIHGEDFEVIVPRKYKNIEHFMNLMCLSDCRNLHDCYARPSQIKLNIYAYWLSWFAELNESNGVTFKQFCGVNSYNIYCFTLQGIMKYYDQSYLVEITPNHNRLIKVVE